MNFKKSDLIKNFINLSSSDYNKKIYRIIPFFRFIEMLKTKQNVLLSPEMWLKDDPFENMLKDVVVKNNSGKGTLAFYNDFYAQCWSTSSLSNALWKIYTNFDRNIAKYDVNSIEDFGDNYKKIYDTAGVRLETTVGKLLYSLFKSNLSKNPDLSFFIGKVQYFSNKNIANYFKGNNILSGDPSDLIKVLLLKRSCFKYENEIRLVFFNHNHSLRGEKIIKYDVDMSILIESVILDPRIKSSGILHKMAADIKKLCAIKTIRQSSLYKLPSKIVIEK